MTRNHPRLTKALTTAALIGTLAISVSVATVPTVDADKPGLVALLLLVFAMVLNGRALWRRPHGAILLVVLACLAMLPFSVILRGFGQIDMMALLFHVEFGVAGAGIASLDTEVLQATVALLFAALSIYFLWSLWGSGWRALGAAAAALVALNPIVQYVARTAMSAPIQSVLPERLAVPVIGPRPDTLPDLVIVFLEGLDRRFADTRFYGDAYAPLRDLETEALSFHAVGQIVGTSWSLAGMVASLCGVPLVPRGLMARNNFDSITQFMPNQICLTDVLDAHGYQMEYVVGGDVRFAGIDAFYRTHGIDTQIGLTALTEMHTAQEIAAAKVDWIVDDQMVFEIARQRHSALLEGAAPYVQVVETIGPHATPGYLSRRCSDGGQAIRSRDEALVVHCTAEDTLAFVRDIQAAHRAADRDRPLKIVVMSDHLSHNHDIPDVAADLRLVNTVMMIGGEGAGVANDTAGSMIDVYPTMLQWLGFAQAPVAAGLGQSLLHGNAPSLVAEFGIAQLDAMIARDAQLSQLLWRGSQ